MVSQALRLAIALGVIHSLNSFSTSRGHVYPRSRTLETSGQRLLASTDPNKGDVKKEKGLLDLVFNPYESKIPKEIEKDIFAAEANTPAAQQRGQRIGLYAVLAFTGILFAFFNGFLTELRSGPTPDGNPIDLADAGFGWVYSNFLTEFLFTNRIGGFICILGGGACGLLAEAEYDTRRINAEKIFDEMQRRRANKEQGSTSGKRVKEIESKRPKRRSGKESKRMSALSEVALVDREEAYESSSSPEPLVTLQEASVPPVATLSTEEPTKADNGIVGKIKGFYEQADTMAATQALLLNKKLEDQGLIEKITDESGFKVIGKDAAAKLNNDKTKPPAD